MINPLTLIPPSEMAARCGSLLVSARSTRPSPTFSNVRSRLAFASRSASRSALVIHALPRVRRASIRCFASYYSVPFFVFYPLLIALFGVVQPLPLIAASVRVAAMVISTLNGLDRVPRCCQDARVHRMSPARRPASCACRRPRRICSPAPSSRSPIRSSASSPANSSSPAAGSAISIAYAYNDFDNRHDVCADAAGDRRRRR